MQFFLIGKIHGSCRNIFLPHLFIFFQRMPADIHAKHFFFKGKELLFIIFFYIRHADFKIFFIFLRHKVKQRHLTCHCIFLLLIYTVHNLHIDHHQLFSVITKTIQCSCFDEILYGAFIQFFSGQTFHKIAEISIDSILVSFPHDCIDHRFSDTFDRRKAISDAFIIFKCFFSCFFRAFVFFYGKSTLALVDIRRKQTDPHLAAVQNIFCHFRWIINDRGHQSCHKFYRIVIFQPCCLICNYRITCRM